jgi:hypothetical protein
VKWSRSSERNEREAAWVDALLHGDEPERSHHLRVHDVDHGPGIEHAERSRRGVPVELDSARQDSRKAPEQEVGIGHRRQLTPMPVADWARIGARAVGPDTNGAALVEPHDRATAGSDRVHRQRRQPDG